MKAVQIGNAGHAVYAYSDMLARGIELVGISSGNHGNEAEGIEVTRQNLIKQGFSPILYESYREMLERERPDVAIVNPWYNDNGEIALYALEHGIHVFCEKPVATDFETLDKLESCANSGNAVLAGMFGSRYMREFVTAKKAVDEGKIGRIRMMDSRKSYRLGKRAAFYSSRETYCGIIPWVAVHAIDWMLWLSGEHYTSVNALHSSLYNGGNGDMDITSAALFGMTNDVIATVTADMYRPGAASTHGDDRVRIVGTDGIVEVMKGRATIITNDIGETELPLEKEGSVFADFLARINGESNDLTAESAIEVTRWALKADMSARGVVL